MHFSPLLVNIYICTCFLLLDAHGSDQLECLSYFAICSCKTKNLNLNRVGQKITKNAFLRQNTKSNN